MSDPVKKSALDSLPLPDDKADDKVRRTNKQDEEKTKDPSSSSSSSASPTVSPKPVDNPLLLKDSSQDIAAMLSMLKTLTKSNAKFESQLADLRAAQKKTEEAMLATVVNNLPAKSLSEETKRPLQLLKKQEDNLLSTLKSRSVLVDSKPSTSTVNKSVNKSSPTSSSSVSSSSSASSSSANAFLALSATGLGDTDLSDRSDDELDRDDPEDDLLKNKSLRGRNQMSENPDVFRNDLHEELAERTRDFRSCTAYVKSFVQEQILKTVHKKEAITANWMHQMEFLAQLIDQMTQNEGNSPNEVFSVSMAVCRLVGILYSIEAGNDFSILDSFSNIAIHGNDATRSDRLASRLKKEMKKKQLLSGNKGPSYNRFSAKGSPTTSRNVNGPRNDWFDNHNSGRNDFSAYLDGNGRYGGGGNRGGNSNGRFRRFGNRGNAVYTNNNGNNNTGGFNRNNANGNNNNNNNRRGNANGTFGNQTQQRPAPQGGGTGQQ
jgi:hypothetical protein